MVLFWLPFYYRIITTLFAFYPCIHLYFKCISRVNKNLTDWSKKEEENFIQAKLKIITQEQWEALVIQELKNLPAVQEKWIWSLCPEDPWRRKWQPSPVFLPGKPHGQRSLAGYSPWGPKELDMNEQLSTHLLALTVSLSSCFLYFQLYLVLLWSHMH